MSRIRRISTLSLLLAVSACHSGPAPVVSAMPPSAAPSLRPSEPAPSTAVVVRDVLVLEGQVLFRGKPPSAPHRVIASDLLSGEPVATGETDAEGRFSVEVPETSLIIRAEGNNSAFETVAIPGVSVDVATTERTDSAHGGTNNAPLARRRLLSSDPYGSSTVHVRKHYASITHRVGPLATAFAPLEALLAAFASPYTAGQAYRRLAVLRNSLRMAIDRTPGLANRIVTGKPTDEERGKLIAGIVGKRALRETMIEALRDAFSDATPAAFAKRVSIPGAGLEVVLTPGLTAPTIVDTASGREVSLEDADGVSALLRPPSGSSGGATTAESPAPVIPAISTFEVGDRPRALALDGDGNAWVINAGAKNVQRIGTDGTVSTPYDVGDEPVAITSDGDGRIWVASANVHPTTGQAVGVVTQFAPDGEKLNTFNNVGMYNGNGLKGAIAVDDDSVVWVANQAEGSLTMFRPVTTGQDYVEDVGPFPSALAIDGDGDVWALCLDRIVELDGEGKTLKTHHLQAEAIAVDDGGNAWLTNSGRNVVTKLDAASGAQTNHDVGAGPSAVALDGSGNVWVTNKADSTVTRVDSDGMTFTYGALYGIGFNAEPSAIAVTRDGYTWVANEGANTVVRIRNGAPFINEVSPSKGTEGTLITITGTNLSKAQYLSFEGSRVSTDITHFTVVSDNEITFEAPSFSEGGTITIQVRAPGGQAVAKKAFTYE